MDLLVSVGEVGGELGRVDAGQEGDVDPPGE